MDVNSGPWVEAGLPGVCGCLLPSGLVARVACCSCSSWGVADGGMRSEKACGAIARDPGRSSVLVIQEFMYFIQLLRNNLLTTNCGPRAHAKPCSRLWVVWPEGSLCEWVLCARRRRPRGPRWAESFLGMAGTSRTHQSWAHGPTHWDERGASEKSESIGLERKVWRGV